ncbi:MAG TPA: aspartate kinase, partial [Ferruginibacter sp.]|nr:aspartate kinase [Ferruginibacter sp.]
MKVFKFGGASINTVERIQNTGNIIRSYPGEKLLIIISAMGKTTNALEKVVDAFYEGKKEEALQFFEQVKRAHLDTLKYLISINWKQAEDQLKDFFTEVEWLLHDKPV